jgi:hypothetical protein
MSLDLEVFTDFSDIYAKATGQSDLRVSR